MFKETGSGAKLDRAERQKVMALAQQREIDAVLVTQRCTLKELESRRVSVIAEGLA